MTRELSHGLWLAKGTHHHTAGGHLGDVEEGVVVGYCAP